MQGLNITQSTHLGVTDGGKHETIVVDVKSISHSMTLLDFLWSKYCHIPQHSAMRGGLSRKLQELDSKLQLGLVQTSADGTWSLPWRFGGLNCLCT